MSQSRKSPATKACPSIGGDMGDETDDAMTLGVGLDSPSPCNAATLAAAAAVGGGHAPCRPSQPASAGEGRGNPRNPLFPFVRIGRILPRFDQPRSLAMIVLPIAMMMAAAGAGPVAPAQERRAFG